MSVKLTSRQVGDVTVIDAAGRITLGEGASAFRDMIRDLSAKGNKKLLLNLSEVSYIDSSGIGELVSEAGGIEQASERSASDHQTLHRVRSIRR
jgi:anti-sigma B factor antagonist